MFSRRQADAPPQPGSQQFTPQNSQQGAVANGSSVMPAGPDVDVSTILSPLIDGSFAQEQGQAAIMAGVKQPSQNGALHAVGTAPLPGTAPLSGTAPLLGTTPLDGGVLPITQVPPQVVHALVQRVTMGLPPETQLVRTAEVEQMLAARFTTALSEVNSAIPAGSQETLCQAVIDEILGLGPLEQLLGDESVSEIMVNGPKQIWIERKGQLIESGLTFLDDAHVIRIAQRIVAPLGRRFDRKWPMVDARLPDGSRVNIIGDPCVLQGTTITIRKFFKTPLTVDNLITYGSMSRQMADFLKECVGGKLNMVVSGGTGSGKTTLLNVLSSFIPDGERIITIEDSAELRLNQRHVVSLESKPADADGGGAVTIRHLVTNSLRMRPERIVVGECRSGETLDMLQAMNTGHDGSLTTLHANTPRDALSRMETMVMMSGMDLPIRVIRQQIASAVDLIVQQARLRDGSRKITYITEVQGMEGETIVLQDIFRFKETGTDANGKVIGSLQPTGLIPNFAGRLEASGHKVDRSLFAQRG